MRRRVVITGTGTVTGFGVGTDALWDALCAGRSCLRPITRFDASGFGCRVAGEASAYSAKDHVPKSYRKAVKVMARDIELAIGAARSAVAEAGLLTRGTLDEGASGEPTYRSERIGCHIGAGLIAAEAEELSAALSTARAEGGAFDLRAWGRSGMDNLTPLWLLKYLPNMVACHVTILHGAEGPSNTITCAEASGLLSIGESVRVIERGDADLCFSGGAESKVNLMGLLRMEKARRLAVSGEETEGWRLVRAFDPSATGTVLGEGAGIVMVEALETAQGRGARVLAEIVGFGAGHSGSTGGYEGDAEGYIAAVENALADAGVGAGEIDAVVPLGCGIPGVDEAEAGALRAVFGDRLAGIPLVTIAPGAGLAMAGAGGLQAAVAVRCVERQHLPARLHAGSCAPGVSAGAWAGGPARLRHVLVSTGSLGGQNAALVIRSAA